MEQTTDATARPTTSGPETEFAAPYAALPPGPSPAPSAGPSTTEDKRFTLRRSRTDRMLGGVCGGLAESLGVDAALIRILLVALTVLGFGAGVVLYVAAWILAPEAD
ncbi:PspC domain-containing protein [Pseudonocardia hispaniensis]|uniref:PspC domain-containing protein n=1 Tax=Pseudonocardia hispaniensis TaxID=904933 RepID=A0ABW1J487_9PSEU